MSSIVLTSLAVVREKAQVTKYLSQFNQIRDAAVAYESDQGNLPPTTSYSQFINELVDKKYLRQPPDLAEMRSVFNMRDADPAILTSIYHCQGDSNPSRYTVYFSDTTSSTRFTGILPEFRVNNSGAQLSDARGKFYCLFTPIR